MRTLILDEFEKSFKLSLLKSCILTNVIKLD